MTAMRRLLQMQKPRPAILKEYTDAEPFAGGKQVVSYQDNEWNNRVSYYIDGKRLVDFRDTEPLTEGWFGFRTTLSRTRITNFHYEYSPHQTSTVPLHWIGDTPEQDKAVSFGIPFDEATYFLQLRYGWQQVEIKKYRWILGH